MLCSKFIVKLNFKHNILKNYAKINYIIYFWWSHNFQGVRDTSDNLQNALQEDRASGHWPIRGLLRQATPAIIRPIVIASQATVQVLSGVKNQIKPEDRREELEKWRYADPNRYKALMSKYHKS